MNLTSINKTVRQKDFEIFNQMWHQVHEALFSEMRGEVFFNVVPIVDPLKIMVIRKI